MFVFKYENDSYGIPYLIATRFSPAGVNPFPVMAGLLTRPSRRAFPALHQWQVAATLRGLTAAGTVPDSHRIPFSSVAANRPEPFPITKIQIFFIIISFTRKKIRNLPESFRTILSEKGFMAKILIARGQATIYVQKDGYTITQSLGEYVFPADDTGKILSSVTLTSTVRVMCGDEELTAFTIGAVGKPAGFSSVTVNNGTKTLTYVITAGTTTLADHGTIDIPVTISGIVYHLSFVWSKAKAGIPGKDGVDADMLDWVKEWNTGKTLINGNTVITPKLFAGTKNSDGTVSGIAIGSFTLNTKTSSGTIAAEAVNGIYGFRDGYKTFYVDNGGNAQLGYGDQYVRYNATTGKVEFGSGVSLNWVGATYIDKDGVFTGTLSADTIKTISISASQITSGIIAAARIDTAALKASLITAGNIEALTLNVTKGKIGGWTVDADSLYRGTKNNTVGSCTSAAGSITLGSNGIRGYKWRLDASGAGAVAGGNIAWDASGNVTFASTVSALWTAPIGSLTTALGGSGYPKLTKITADGIYTGSITASQITAGTISADRIAAGSIAASKLDAASIRSSIINTDYINGLSCTFTKGKIGGWMIGASALTATHISIDSGNRRIAVYGANSGVASGQRVQLYYNSDTDFGLYTTDSAGYCVAQLGSSNSIAGWTIDTTSIRKGNVSLGSDGSIINSTKWKLNNDGSGQIASGNIAWDTAGNVTFGASVSLQWKNDIEAAKVTNFGYRYYKKLIINGDEATYYPVVFKGGDQNIKRTILVRRGYAEQAPVSWNTSTHKGGLIVLIKTNFGGWGGIAYSWDIYDLSETYCRMFAGAQLCGNYCMFAVFLRGGGDTGAVYHLYSDQPIESSSYSPSPIPAAPQIAYGNDLIFQSGSTQAYAPAPRTLTAAVEEEIRRHRFIALAQSTDSTLAAHPLTYIGSTGIYTGTLTAAQVNAVAIDAGSIKTGTLSADRIAAGSISASKLDAVGIKSSIINTDYINGLSCTFTKGKIGGFSIGSDNMTIGNVGAVGAIPLQIRSASTGSGYWYTGAYKPLGICLTWYQSSNAGHIVLGQVAASGNSVKTGFIGLQMMSWDNLEYFCLSVNYTKSGSKEVYNRIAGWAFDHNHIWKNNISLGSDGSIANSTKWSLNNDGSGHIASGNISWNAAGTVTFAASVSAQWTTGITTAQELASAMAFGKMLYRDPTFWNGNNGVVVYNNSQNGMVTVTRQQDATAPNDSKYVLKIQTSGSASPRNGGFYFGAKCGYRKVLVARIIAKIPAGRNICWATNSIGTGGSSRWLTPTAGTGDWKEYIYKVVCGTSNFSSTHYFYIDGAQGTASTPLTWYVAYATVFDLTSTEKYTTTIDANGVYTGTVKANQIIVDSALVVGGSSYNGSVSVRDANNAVKVTLDRTGITAVAGKIGGWAIGTSSLTASAPSSGHRIVISASGYIYHDNPSSGKDYWGLKIDGSATFGCGKISFAADGSGYLANQNIKWDAGGNVTMTGTINANAGTIGGFSIGQGRIGSTASGSGSGGGLAIYNDLFRVGNTTSYVLFGANTFPASTGGTCATGRIVNNKYNSYLNNYGLYIEVKNGYRNYGVWSNAALVGPAAIGIKMKTVYFTGSGYSIDFSAANIFCIYANATYNVSLPSASSVASMFGYSSLPSDFAYVFTLFYSYNWGGHVNIMNVRNQNGGTTNYGMERGDSLTLLCCNYPSFHYQALNYNS